MEEVLQYYGRSGHEWPIWQRYYAPVSVRGRTVLDVGAGCGETAYLYFAKGAQKLICVEPNLDCVKCLIQNAKRHSWNIEVVPEPFSLRLLSDYRFDFMKMDCEGCESGLLQVEELPSTAIIESHSPEITRALASRFGAETVFTTHQGISLLLVRKS